MRVMGGLVAEALHEHEHARIAGIAMHVEREDAGLGASGRDELRQGRLDRGHLIVACDPAGYDEHQR